MCYVQLCRTQIVKYIFSHININVLQRKHLLRGKTLSEGSFSYKIITGVTDDFAIIRRTYCLSF